MRNFSLVAAISAAVLITTTGCGGEFASVSGTVVYDGKPVPKLRVSFSPEPIGENYSPGPFSKGVTNEDGRFSLTTRYNDTGAFIGRHKLSFVYTDIPETAMSDLRVSLSDAKDNADNERFAETKKKIEKLKKKLKDRPVLGNFKAVFVDVPAGGMDDFQLDLKEYERGGDE